jgi:hypothetical protein
MIHNIQTGRQVLLHLKNYIVGIDTIYQCHRDLEIISIFCLRNSIGGILNHGVTVIAVTSSQHSVKIDA